MNKIKTSDSLTIGFALFAMFFGAGNLIFPPFLGWEAGKSWFAGFLCFIFIDIGMSLLAMIVIAKSEKGAEELTGRLGSKLSFVLLALNCLCIGPFVAIPRTASITYEVGVVPNFGEVNSWLCTGIFFGISFLLSVRQSKVVDIVGKVLAPLMFVALVGADRQRLRNAGGRHRSCQPDQRRSAQRVAVRLSDHGHDGGLHLLGSHFDHHPSKGLYQTKGAVGAHRAGRRRGDYPALHRVRRTRLYRGRRRRLLCRASCPSLSC